MDACATLTRRVEHLELDKVAQTLEITKLKRRVKKLEKRNKVRVLKLKSLQKVRTSQRIEIIDDTVMDDKSNQERMIAEMDQDDAIVLEDDKEEDREVVDTVKDVEMVKVDESARDQGRQAEYQVEIYKIDMDHANKVLSMQEDGTEPADVHEVVEVVTTIKISYEVTAASDPITAASTTIPTFVAQVPAITLTAASTRVAASPSRRRKGVVIRDPKSESTTSTIIPTETKSKDKGKEILVDEPKHLKKKQQIKQDEQYARELHAKLNKDIDWDEVIDHVKIKAKEDPAVKMYQAVIRKPQTKSQARKNMILYLKKLLTKGEMEEEDNKALQKLNETLTKRAAKRRKLDDEVEELKRHLQIVPNKDDDVYSEATPLARKLILLVERKYSLTRFTLDQMLNDVRLEVEEEREVFLELLRFIRQQNQGASFTQGIVSSIHIGGNISPRGFLPSILLLVVIMVVVVIVVVTIILVVIMVVKVAIAIIGVVIVVGDLSSILKLSFMITSFLYRNVFHYLC
nr:hypothetical protein [Tanacetum cinerariifolium]